MDGRGCHAGGAPAAGRGPQCLALLRLKGSISPCSSRRHQSWRPTPCMAHRFRFPTPVPHAGANCSLPQLRSWIGQSRRASVECRRRSAGRGRRTGTSRSRRCSLHGMRRSDTSRGTPLGKREPGTGVSVPMWSGSAWFLGTFRGALEPVHPGGGEERAGDGMGVPAWLRFSESSRECSGAGAAEPVARHASFRFSDALCRKPASTGNDNKAAPRSPRHPHVVSPPYRPRRCLC
jgi:hypothetical protein